MLFKIKMAFEKLLDKIMDCDPYVRFATISDMNGNHINSVIQKDITNFLPPEEMNDSIQQAVNMWKFRNKVQRYVGKGHYVLAVYDKVKRVTIPIGDKHLLLVALDNRGGQKDIVERIRNILSGDPTRPITWGPQN